MKSLLLKKWPKIKGLSIILCLITLQQESLKAQNISAIRPAYSKDKWQKLEFKRPNYENEVFYYQGEVSDNRANGYGEASTSEKSVYKGYWKDNNFHGKGKHEWATGDVYDGNWLNGERNGKGMYKWADGNVYDGDWVNGKINGRGKYKWTNGGTYEGEWQDNNMTGFGKLTNENGNIVEEGRFEDGVLKVRQNVIAAQSMMLKIKAQDHIAKEQYDLALQTLDQAIKANPIYAAATYGLIGQTYVNKYVKSGSEQDREKALTNFTKAIDLDPEYAEGYFYRSAVYSNMSEHSKAIDDIGRAISLDPSVADYIKMRDMIYEIAGKTGKDIK